jgi:hypothetical protein
MPPPLGRPIGPAPPARKRGIRPFTWAILVVNALFLVWTIAAAAAAPEAAAGHVGAGMSVLLIMVLWACVDVVLGVTWFVTRRRDPGLVVVQRPAGRVQPWVDPMRSQPPRPVHGDPRRFRG